MTFINKIRKTEVEMREIAERMVRDLNRDLEGVTFFYRAHIAEIDVCTEEMLFTVEEIRRIEKILGSYGFYLDYFHIAEYNCNNLYFEFVAIPKP